MPFRYLELDKDEYNALWLLVVGPALSLVFGAVVATGKEALFLPVTLFVLLIFYYANTLWKLIYRLRTEEEKTYWPPKSDIHGRFGRLIVVEGLDGSGKTTQVSKLLEKSNYPTRRTTWSALKLGEITNNGSVLLSPAQISDLHYNYFSTRHKEILAALDDGQIVICDRYFYTALARDKARGVRKPKDYSFAVTPDIVIYLDIEPETAVQRVLKRIEQSKLSSDNSLVETLSFYEAGHDLNLHPDITENFKIFHARTAQQYWKLVKDYDMVTLNSLDTVDSLGSQIERLVRPLLPPEEMYKHNSKLAITVWLIAIMLYIPFFIYNFVK